MSYDREFWDNYAKENESRYNEEFAKFIRDLAVSLRCKSILEIGCGTGVDLRLFPDTLDVHGVDLNDLALDMAKKKNPTYQTFVADSLMLPLRSGSVDCIISIAVVHHFSTDSLRIQAISEFHRVLRTGGRCLIYVWAYEQEHKKFQQQDVFVKWNLQDTYTKKDKKKTKGGAKEV